MMLEAVWFKDSKEIFCVSPVVNVICYEDMEGISDIEVENGYAWYTCKDFDVDADDFVIRIKKD